jgi:parallel beta-helix repeat protein
LLRHFRPYQQKSIIINQLTIINQKRTPQNHTHILLKTPKKPCISTSFVVKSPQNYEKNAQIMQTSGKLIKLIIPTLILLLAAPAPAYCKTITVDDNGPADFNDIQAAIDVAVDGDTVVVADGTYTGNIDFRGKAITLQSVDGPGNCIIYCGGSGWGCFEFSRGEDANSTLDGFTITSSANYFAGTGIFCYGSSPTINNCKITGMQTGIYLQDCNSKITNCIIKDNKGEGNGGIHCCSASPTISNSIITGNVATGGFLHRVYGGGIGCVEGSSPTIKDCIISDNIASYGGGIACMNESNPIIINCTISGNAGRGSGIYCENSSPTINYCTISDSWGDEGWGVTCSNSVTIINNCQITGNAGGGVNCWRSNLTIANCTIHGNKSCGIACSDSTAAIDSCIISGNAAGEYRSGGGIDCHISTMTVINSTIADNLAEWGGGISAGGGSTTMIANCVVSNNRAESEYAYGGGIFYGGGNHIISNCEINGNKAKGGGGIDCTGSSPTITNCTIASNTAEDSGGGISSTWEASPILANCILWGNTASQGNQIAVGHQDPPWDSSLTISYSDVQGGQDEVYISPNSELSWGPGNTISDPCFLELGYWGDVNDPNIILDANDPNAIWIDGDYHLLSNSPCIDTGDPNYTPEPNETDLDGNRRLVDGTGDGTAVVDMGAYEFWPPVEAEMTLTPHSLSCASKGRWVKAHIVLPEGYLPEDVDLNTPAVAEPMDVESEYIKVFASGKGPVAVEIRFDRAAFCEGLTETGEIEVTVTGYLTTGQYFYATDAIRIKPKRRQIIRKIVKKRIE